MMMKSWLARVRHDLLKHALWCARDLREGDGALSPKSIAALRASLLSLPDEAGEPISLTGLWQRLREDLPGESGEGDGALDAFGAACATAEAAGIALDVAFRACAPSAMDAATCAASLDTVLDLDRAFTELARRLNSRSATQGNQGK